MLKAVASPFSFSPLFFTHVCFCSLSLSSNDIEYLENETMVLFADHSYSMSHLNHSVRQPIDGAKKKTVLVKCFLLNFARLEIILHVEFC